MWPYFYMGGWDTLLSNKCENPRWDTRVQNDSAVLEMGDHTLKKIASELVTAIRESVNIDWNLKEGVRATMRAKIKRLLTQYDYPPDKEEKAIELVLEQAELFAVNETG